MKFLIILSIIFLIESVKSASILGIITTPSRSHSILLYELFKSLATELGHDVVMIQPKGNELKDPPANYTNIVIDHELLKLHKDIMDDAFVKIDDNPVKKFKEFLELASIMTSIYAKHPKVEELFNSGKKFDLVISELALNEGMLGFSEHYKCPHILLSTVGGITWTEEFTFNPSPLSFTPHVFLALTDKMTLIERLQNTLFYGFEQMLMHALHYPKQRRIYEEDFPSSKDFRPFWEKVRHGVSMIFLNSHYSLSFPRSYLPNLVEVGGMHIKKKVEPLPEDIQSFIDNSEHGVVYFSMGGNLYPSSMPPAKQQAIINSLSKIKQRVLWKWDDESINIDRSKFLVRKWFPQDSILASDKVKLFITHGGLLSGTESVYYGKPLIVIPVFGDQGLNAQRTVASGFGLRVDYTNLTETSLSWALNEILTDDKYSVKVKELSKRFRDKPQHPLDLAKFYVEYVLRHDGAPFMQSSATDLNFIEYYNIDVFIIIGIGLILLIFIPFFILRTILGVLLKNRKKYQDGKAKRS